MDSLIVKATFAIFLGFTASLLIGQDNCKCCSEQYREFDFWIGMWDVYDTIGNKVGENEITTVEKGCAIIEKWTGSGGGTGTSINFYDQQETNWNQVWVSSNGGILKLKGTFEDGQMTLKSEPYLVDSVFCYNQIKWSKINNEVRQEWDIYDTSGNLMRKVFTGIYIKKS